MTSSLTGRGWLFSVGPVQFAWSPVGPTGTGHHLSENTVSDNYGWARKERVPELKKIMQGPHQLNSRQGRTQTRATQLTRNPLAGAFLAYKRTIAAESINRNLSPRKKHTITTESNNRKLSPQKSTQLPRNLLTGTYLRRKAQNCRGIYKQEITIAAGPINRNLSRHKSTQLPRNPLAGNFPAEKHTIDAESTSRNFPPEKHTIATESINSNLSMYIEKAHNCRGIY